MENVLQLLSGISDKIPDKISIEDLTCRLFVMGHTFNFWNLINPFHLLKNIKMKWLISSSVWPYIIVSNINQEELGLTNITDYI